jgi:predicted SAM-dependent methyltransferase
MFKQPILRLNLGCGANKIPGYINIDTEKSTNPDLVHDFVTAELPFSDSSAAEILLFHTIEHISKKLHKKVLLDIWRVLRPGGRLLISYPEFTKCYEFWKVNKRGLKDFWEATMFGRQLYASDFHISLMHTPDFRLVLNECGFHNLVVKTEPLEVHNTVISAVKGEKFIPYEEMLKKDMTSFSVKKVTLNDKSTNKRRHSR